MGVNIFMFHPMPYGHPPASYEGPAWVTCPNELYDPARGHELCYRHIDELVYAENGRPEALARVVVEFVE